MIKFFRKIRQKLLSENKIRKYLIYAVGEIILVVIGILIALSINNRNEERKFKKEVINQLILVSKELEYDITNYRNISNRTARHIDYVKRLSQGRYQELDLKDFWIPVTSNLEGLDFGDSYKTLKETGGLNIVDDPMLVKMLSNYHNYSRKHYSGMQNYDVTITQQFIEPKLLDVVEFDSNNQLIEENIITIIQDRKLNNIYNYRLKILENERRITLNNLADAQDLLERLENYLKINIPEFPDIMMDSKRTTFEEINLPKEQLDKFVGTYFRALDTFAIAINQEQLFIQLSNGSRIQIFPYAEDKFFVKAFYEQLDFKKENGEFIGFRRMQSTDYYQKQ